VSVREGVSEGVGVHVAVECGGVGVGVEVFLRERERVCVCVGEGGARGDLVRRLQVPQRRVHVTTNTIALTFLAASCFEAAKCRQSVTNP
jgi:hypothetical protein